MLVESVPATLLATNSWVIAPAVGEHCVIVDAGGGLDSRLVDLIERNRLTPAAVLVTHGHFDHTMSAAAVGARYDVPVYLHQADAWQLDEPWRGVGIPDGAVVPGLTDTRPERPDRLVELTGSESLTPGGLNVEVVSVPGHTPGSVLYRISDDGDPLLFTGDFLFAGSIGRMDLPGGDEERMAESLRRTVRAAAPDSFVGPGHGPATTIGAERRTNPYLQELA